MDEEQVPVLVGSWATVFNIQSHAALNIELDSNGFDTVVHETSDLR
jgi:hypothetical protein